MRAGIFQACIVAGISAYINISLGLYCERDSKYQQQAANFDITRIRVSVSHVNRFGFN